MSLTIDFDTLKFNLYEILNISADSSETKIKKAFRNLIINFHPDKNNQTEEEIYYHIITANQILTNKESRKKYDEYLEKNELSHFDLKKNFEKTVTNQPKKLDSLAIHEFTSKLEELNKKHNANDELNKKNVLQNYEKLLKDREFSLHIPKENISTAEDFNNKFESKKELGTFNNDIISVDEEKAIASYNINDNYTTLDLAFNNLYIEGESLNTNKYSSLNAAFKLQPVNDKISKSDSIKEAMEKYKNETTSLSNNTKFLKDKYDSWFG